MTKSLFNDYECYIKEGQDLDREVCETLKPIYQKYLDAGFKIRDVGHIMSSTVSCLESELALVFQFDKRKKNK